MCVVCVADYLCAGDQELGGGQQHVGRGRRLHQAVLPDPAHREDGQLPGRPAQLRAPGAVHQQHRQDHPAGRHGQAQDPVAGPQPDQEGERSCPHTHTYSRTHTHTHTYCDTQRCDWCASSLLCSSLAVSPPHAVIPCRFLCAD